MKVIRELVDADHNFSTHVIIVVRYENASIEIKCNNTDVNQSMKLVNYIISTISIMLVI